VYIKSILILTSLLALTSCMSKKPETPPIYKDQIEFGREYLLSTLRQIDQTGELARGTKIVTVIDSSAYDNAENLKAGESYCLKISDKQIEIAAIDAAGILYGCMHATKIIKQNKSLPGNFQFSDAPRMKWRGISIQLMKLGQYNFAITPEEFPFFYDKSLWQKTFQFLLDNRFNYIIFWNGHPFDYLVKFDRFQEAQSGMSDELIQKNHDMFRWLIAEGQKRNITIFFQFYNIHTSVFFQEAHQLPPQIAKPTKFLEEYTEYSISKFVHEFPEVGLFVTAGEGIELQYSVSWINDVVFKAVKQTGQTPPIFIRAWFFDLPHARKLVNNYPDLSFVRKFNVEMIAGQEVDPENAEWAKLNDNFIVNIHLAANLEPFRWNPPSYIQNIIRNNISAGASGIHLHPRKAWRWPYSSEKGRTDYQWQRDELWFHAWGRYAWNPFRDSESERLHWLDLLTTRYGDEKAANHFLKSFESGADILPALQRLIWLGHDNHSIISAGATLVQLQNSKGIPFLSLGRNLRINQYVNALMNKEEITGIHPVDYVKNKMDEAKESLKEAESGARYARKNLEETRRIVNDAQAIYFITKFYFDKLHALKFKTLYDAAIDPDSNKISFIKYLTQSVQDFRKLVETTTPTYQSMSDVPAKHPARLKINPYHWKDVLPVFENELEIYKNDVSVRRDPTFFQPSLPGLAGIWYSEPNFIDAERPAPADSLNFTWNSETEGVGRHWSVKWFGFIKTPVKGTVNFYLTADRGVNILIGNDYFTADKAGDSELVGTTIFEVDSAYRFEVYYDHQTGERGNFKLEWRWDGGPKEVVKGDYLWHSPAQKHETKLLVELINL
jgi:hypothetical protein